ncbi:MAG TPA: hypothetical protein VG502_10780 [Flexivirga sp.]|uniref:hypothetical protein n=1 Tax=Flexivirga sp. TaxID=1962927 RepID=UPI002C48AA57|nr:hypothetical protein [Flexivirga sp.]HWC22772.1 hypothetical protein [Flexivirga sp.]
MKETQVDQDGRVRCPVCGGADFSDKRTGKAKLGAAGLGVLTLGVGGALAAAAAPKRLKCRGCGENLKRGGGPYKPRKGMPGYVEPAKPSGADKLAASRAKLEASRAGRDRAKAEREARRASRGAHEVDEKLARQRLMAEREAARKNQTGS